MALGLQIARKLVYEFGLGDFRTPSYVPSTQIRSFVDFSNINAVENTNHNPNIPILPQGELDYTPEIKHKMEKTALFILNTTYMDAKNYLEAYKPALLYLTLTLKEKEEISGTELVKIIAKHPPKRDI
jgi:ATP-dependent Zn protease